MKYFFFLLSFSNVLLFSQNDWSWQNPLPQGNTLYSVSFADSLIGWAVGEHGTIIKSTDGGETWSLQQSTITERLHSVHAFNENSVYAVSENGTVLKTTDGGESWNAQSGSQSGINESFFINENLGWMIGNGGTILKTIDAGNNWSLQTSGTNNDLFGIYFVGTDSGLIVGDSSTVLQTTDGGSNWIPLTIEPGLAVGKHAEASQITEYIKTNAGWSVYNEQANILVVVGDNGYISTSKNGTVWSKRNSGVSFDLKSVTGYQNEDYLLLVAAGDNGCIVYSLDEGETWHPSFFGSGELNMVLGFIGAPPIGKNLNKQADNIVKFITVGMHGLIGISTDDGKTWSAKSSSIVNTNTNLTTIAKAGSNLWVAGHSGKVLLTTDGGDNWTVQTTGTTQTFNSISFVDENTGWVTSNFLGQGTIRKTTDGGDSWFTQTSGISVTINNINFIDENTGWVTGGGGTILKSTDGGGIWNPQSSGTNNAIFSTSIVNENTVWAVGSNGIILKTDDGGTNWNTQPSGTTNTLRSVTSVNENTAYAVGLFDTIIKTTDGGINWIPQTSGTTNSYLRSVFFVDENNGWTAGLNGTLLRTTNGGTEWLQLNSGTNKNIEAVLFIDANAGWIAGDNGAILKTTTGGGVTSIDEKSRYLLPDDFILYQNYPNPFNPVTVIGYRLPVISNVSLKVYDALGREIAILVNEEKPAGRYEVVFDGSGLSSSVYFYKYTVTPHSGKSGIFSEVKKLLLLK